MGEWISEHKGIFIAIIAVVAALAVAITGTVLIKNKNANKNEPESDTVNGAVNEGTYDVQTVDGETQSESQTSETSSVSETTGSSSSSTESSTQGTSAVSASQTQSEANMPDVLPNSVKVMTDGNKKIYYPYVIEKRALNKKYPVIVWANGTGMPTEGYDGLLKKFAVGGYIVIADSSVMTAQGEEQIDSIDYIIGKNSDSSSIFYGRVDTGKIGATGHSQGGRSSVNAAQKDKRIKCIVSIAGASSAEESKGLTTPALFLTGTADMVVISSQWCKPSYNAVEGRAVYASLKGAGHTVCMTNPEKVSGYTLAWFDAYLKNDSAAKAKFQSGGQLANDTAWQDFASKN